MIKKIIIRAIVFIVVAVSTAFFVNKFNNAGYKYASREMDEPMLPLVYCEFDGKVINMMQGYTMTMSTSLMRDCIVPLDDEGGVKILVKDAEKFGKNYRYELRSINGDSLVENGDLTMTTAKDGYHIFKIPFRMDMDINQEYVLVFCMSNEDESITAKYYTRVVRLKEQYAKKIIDFAMDFHNTTFVKEVNESEGNLVYDNLKTGRVSENPDLSHVDLYSSYSLISFGDLVPIPVTGIVPTITEIDSEYAVVKLSYVVQSINTEETHYYTINEFYSAIYDRDSEKITLLAFDRYQESYFDVNYISKERNSISMGISDAEIVEYKSSEDSNKLAFVKNGQLWMYDYDKSMLTSVFSYIKGNYTDVRTLNTNHGIKISDIDNNGDMYFVVYGYTNRGAEEGKNGITLYSYTAEDSKTKELVFITCDETYDVMKQEVGRFTYFDVANNVFYYLLDGAVYKFDISKIQQSVLVENLPSEKYVVSENGRIIAYPNNEVDEEVTEIHLHNFESGEEYVKKCNPDERLMANGFVGNDMIFGTAKKGDIVIAADGGAILPFFAMSIVSSDGQIIKQYSKDEVYIMNAKVEDEKIYLQRAKKQNNFYVGIDADFIAYKSEANDDVVQLAYNYDSLEMNQLDLKLPADMFISDAATYVITKNKEAEREEEFDIKTTTRDNSFYVFNNVGYVGEYKSAGKSIIDVENSNSGLVVDSNGNTIYRTIEATSYNTVADDIKEVKCGSVEETLMACAFMCIEYQDSNITYDDVKACKSWEEAFEKYTTGVGVNISGIDLDVALYFLDRDIPVATKIGDGRYVLLISYNSTHVRYYDPLAGEEVKISRDNFQEELSLQSNTMYTYTSQ